MADGREASDAEARGVELNSVSLDELTITNGDQVKDGPPSSPRSQSSNDNLNGGEQYGDEQGEYPEPGNSSLAGAVFNFINSIIGAGILGLAFAIRECGFGMGLFFLFFVAWLTYYSVNIIIFLGLRHKASGYEGVGEACFGKAGFILVSFFMLIFAFGALCAYLVIIGDTMTVVLGETVGTKIPRQLVIFLFDFFLILPLCLFRDLAVLASTSGVSVFAVIAMLIICLVKGPSAVASWPGVPVTPDYGFINTQTFFAGLGAISFAYVCQHSSFIVFSTLKKPTSQNWNIVNLVSVSSALILSLLFGLGGYLTFFNVTQANLLNNYPCDDVAVNGARVLLAVTMILTYPMEHFVVRYSLFAIVKGVSPTLTGPNRMSDVWHYSLSAISWIPALAVALIVTDLGFVLELTGAFAASFLGYVLPAVFFFKSTSLEGRWREMLELVGGRERRPSYIGRTLAVLDFIMPFVLLLFGIIACVVGTYSALVRGHQQAPELCFESTSQVTDPDPIAP